MELTLEEEIGFLVQEYSVVAHRLCNKMLLLGDDVVSPRILAALDQLSSAILEEWEDAD